MGHMHMKDLIRTFANYKQRIILNSRCYRQLLRLAANPVRYFETISYMNS